MHLSIATTPASLKHFKAPSTQKIRDALLIELRKIMMTEQRVGIKALNKLVSNWETEVAFDYEIKEASDQISVTIKTDNKIFYFVDQGTRVRYATMTDDFFPQTSHGKLTSRSKVGGVAFINKHLPRPGIAPREFMKTLLDSRRQVFSNKIIRVYRKVFRENLGL